MAYDQYLIPYIAVILGLLGAVFFFARKRKMEKQNKGT